VEVAGEEQEDSREGAERRQRRCMGKVEGDMEEDSSVEAGGQQRRCGRTAEEVQEDSRRAGCETAEEVAEDSRGPCWTRFLEFSRVAGKECNRCTHISGFPEPLRFCNEYLLAEVELKTVRN
jgi:hypothetical protein